MSFKNVITTQLLHEDQPLLQILQFKLYHMSHKTNHSIHQCQNNNMTIKHCCGEEASYRYKVSWQSMTTIKNDCPQG